MKKKVVSDTIICWNEEGFPENCGIDVLCGFSGDEDVHYYDEYDDNSNIEPLLYSKPLRWFQRLTKAQLAPLRDKFLKYRSGILLASTAVLPTNNDDVRQQDEGAKIEVLLSKTGWKALRTTNNPNSGNMITLWEFIK